MFDVEKIRNDFPMIRNNPNLIYFDSSATSFKPQCVINEINDYYTKLNSNIHRGDYDISVVVSKIYDETRKVIAEYINCDNPKCIVYTSGATSSLNLVAYSYLINNIKENDVILTTLSEHASSILPLFEISKLTKSKIEYIELNEDGTFNLENYRKSFINNNVRFVCLPQISNVLGYINPIKEITEIAHANNAIVSIDGAQSVPHMKVDVKDLDIDFLSFSSHKMLGPAGIGVLYGKYELLEKMNPTLYGGGANARFNLDGEIILKDVPEKFEAGTPNIEGVLGLNKAIKYINSIGIDNIEKYQKELSEYFINKLLNLDNVIIYNPKSTTGIVTFNIKDIFAQDAAAYFNSKGIAVRTGNHCAKLLFNVIGATETIRASLYFYNTKNEIDKFVDVIKETTIEKCVDVVL